LPEFAHVAARFVCDSGPSCKYLHKALAAIMCNARLMFLKS